MLIENINKMLASDGEYLDLMMEDTVSIKGQLGNYAKQKMSNVVIDENTLKSIYPWIKLNNGHVTQWLIPNQLDHAKIPSEDIIKGDRVKADQLLPILSSIMSDLANSQNAFSQWLIKQEDSISDMIASAIKDDQSKKELGYVIADFTHNSPLVIISNDQQILNNRDKNPGLYAFVKTQVSISKVADALLGKIQPPIHNKLVSQFNWWVNGRKIEVSLSQMFASIFIRNVFIPYVQSIIDGR